MDSNALKQLVEELLGTLDVPIDSVTVGGTHRTVVAVTTPEPQKLIGADGDTLRAINTIAKRLAESLQGADGKDKGPATSFIIDVNGYQESKLDGVRTNARQLAQRARLFKHDVELEPMSPYERLVIHELFAEDPEIGTESAGEGKFRHVVLKYKQKEAQ